MWDITPSSKERRLERREIFEGKVLHLVVDRVERPDGSIAVRELVLHPKAVTILPILSDGKILLVGQYRHPVSSSLWEVPAGKLKPGEEPLACAKRELREETGYTATRWEELMTFYTSPGFTDEQITLFRALDLTKVDRPRPGEIDSLRMVSSDDIGRLIENGTICDAKTILAILSSYLPAY